MSGREACARDTEVSLREKADSVSVRTPLAASDGTPDPN